MKEFLNKYLPQHGDDAKVCTFSGLHPNYLSSYRQGRCKPNLITFIWLCRGIAQHTGLEYKTIVMDALAMIEFPQKKRQA